MPVTPPPNDKTYFELTETHLRLLDHAVFTLQDADPVDPTITVDLSGLYEGDDAVTADDIEVVRDRLAAVPGADTSLDDAVADLPTVLQILTGQTERIPGIYYRDDADPAGDWDRIDLGDKYESYRDQLHALTDDQFDEYVARYQDEDDRSAVVEELTDAFIEELTTFDDDIDTEVTDRIQFHDRLVYRKLVDRHLARLVRLAEQDRRREHPRRRVEQVVASKLDVGPRTAASVAATLDSKDLLADNDDTAVPSDTDDTA